LLILEIPRNELYFRTQVVIFFTLFGIIIARLFSTRKKAYLALHKAKIELENRVEKRTAKLSEANQLLNEEFAERIRVDNALKKSEERYRIVSELTTDFAYAFRMENEDTLSLEWVTEALYRITGFTWDELRLRGGWHSIVHPDDVGIVDNQLKAFIPYAIAK
jgi:PAS domain-containing protein